MEDRRTWKAATDLWREAYDHQMEGELDRAIELYRRSIEVYPTPEAHTFLGWTSPVAPRGSPYNRRAS
jgi:hypothetical protein